MISQFPNDFELVSGGFLPNWSNCACLLWMAAALLLKNGLISFFSRLLWYGSLRGLWRMVYRKSDEIVKDICLLVL